MLSVVITAWNEEKNLPRVVASVKKLADEIIVVVDKASTDQTAEVAKKLGCRVFSHVHTGIVEPMRNFSISKAIGPWVLLLDADEEVSTSLSSLIQKKIKDGKDYYRIPRKNIIFGQWIKNTHWWPDYVYRLFKKGSITWENTVHSIPFTKGEGGDFPATEEAAIIHHHYDSISQYVDRLNRYTDYQADSLQKSGYIFAWADLITKPFAEFLRQFFARKGYQDGLHGLALAGLQAFSELVLYLKVWQARGFTPAHIPIPEFEKVIKSKSQELSWWVYQGKIDTAPFFSKMLLKIWRALAR